MDGIKQQVHARRVEALENKHVHETRKIKREMRSELEEVKENKLATINDVSKEYDKKLMTEKNSLQLELAKVRSSNDELLKDEEERYKNLVAEIKASHSGKIAELKISQEKEVEKRSREHRDSLDSLEQKFEQASVQYKT